MAGGAGRRLGRRKKDGSGYPDGRQCTRIALPDPLAPRPSAVGHPSAITIPEGWRCWRRKAWDIVDVSHYLVTSSQVCGQGWVGVPAPSHPASCPSYTSGRRQTIQPLNRAVPEQTNPSAQDPRATQSKKTGWAAERNGENRGHPDPLLTRRSHPEPMPGSAPPRWSGDRRVRSGHRQPT